MNKFNNIVSETGINVITDSQGNMEMDAPANMSDEVAKKKSVLELVLLIVWLINGSLMLVS